MTRAHVRLLGPCFKTGRVGDRPTRCQPPVPDGSAAASGAPRFSVHTVGVRRKGVTPLPRSVPRLRGGDVESREGTRDTTVWRRATDGTANNRRPARGGPPATCHLPTFRPSRLHCQTGCSVLRTRDKCVCDDESRGGRRPLSREALLVLPPPRPPTQTESSRHRISRAHPFTSEQFHVLLNSLFKVLCNFPSRYLFAIGLTAVFSLRWSLPPY